MFNFPGITPRPIIHAEQLCVKCSKWFTLPTHSHDTLLVWWRNEHKGHPFVDVACPYCGGNNLLIAVGKYDPPDLVRERCGVQCIVTAGAKLLTTRPRRRTFAA